jgi:hypothetical protein
MATDGNAALAADGGYFFRIGGDDDRVHEAAGEAARQTHSTMGRPAMGAQHLAAAGAWSRAARE